MSDPEIPEIFYLQMLSWTVSWSYTLKLPSLNELNLFLTLILDNLIVHYCYSPSQLMWSFLFHLLLGFSIKLSPPQLWHSFIQYDPSFFLLLWFLHAGRLVSTFRNPLLSSLSLFAEKSEEIFDSFSDFPLLLFIISPTLLVVNATLCNVALLISFTLFLRQKVFYSFSQPGTDPFVILMPLKCSELEFK